MTGSARIVELGVGDPRLALVWPVLRELRPHLDDEECATRFATAVDERGLRLLAVLTDDACLAVATFTLQTSFHLGLHAYVDDLVTTAAARSAGHGKALLDHVAAVTVAAGGTAVRLDSGVQRHAAHRFYLRERFDIASHSFLKRLAGDAQATPSTSATSKPTGRSSWA